MKPKILSLIFTSTLQVILEDSRVKALLKKIEKESFNFATNLIRQNFTVEDLRRRAVQDHLCGTFSV